MSARAAAVLVAAFVVFGARVDLQEPHAWKR
jgi:hypothetical protein